MQDCGICIKLQTPPQRLCAVFLHVGYKHFGNSFESQLLTNATIIKCGLQVGAVVQFIYKDKISQDTWLVLHS